MHETTSYFIVDAGPDILEFWVDWIPSVDDGLMSLTPSPRKGTRLGRDFCLTKEGEDGGRLFKNVQEDVLSDLEHFNVFAVFCGPSGVLARVPVLV